MLQVQDKRTAARHETHRFGFPVVIHDAPMAQVMGAWVLDVNSHALQRAVLRALAFKPTPLTGAQVRCIRTALELPVREFANKLGVTHTSVVKWEARRQDRARIRPPIESILRLLVLAHLEEHGRESADRLLAALATGFGRSGEEHPVEVNASALAA